MPSLPKQFRDEVERLLLAKGITRAELAQKMGVKKPFVYQILKEDANPTLKTILRVAEALDYDLAIVLSPKVKRRRTG